MTTTLYNYKHKSQKSFGQKWWSSTRAFNLHLHSAIKFDMKANNKFNHPIHEYIILKITVESDSGAVNHEYIKMSEYDYYVKQLLININ